MKKTLIALLAALIAVVAFRSLVLTVCTIDGSGLSPVLLAGDRVVVNRWSYGLRAGGGLFHYGRIGRQPVERGDIIAFEDTLSRLFICRCTHLPGDTIAAGVVPGLSTCAQENFYWVEPLGEHNQAGSSRMGFIPERSIVGRVCLILYSRDGDAPWGQGFRSERLLLPL